MVNLLFENTIFNFFLKLPLFFLKNRISKLYRTGKVKNKLLLLNNEKCEKLNFIYCYNDFLKAKSDLNLKKFFYFQNNENSKVNWIFNN